MRRVAVLLILLAAGCSNAPVADWMDFWFPGRLKGDPKNIYGGVGSPQLPPPVSPPPPPGGMVPPP